MTDDRPDVSFDSYDTEEGVTAETVIELPDREFVVVESSAHDRHRVYERVPGEEQPRRRWAPDDAESGKLPAEVEPGDRIQLISTNDPYTDLEPGAKGTVEKITESVVEGRPMSEVHVDWEDGGYLTLLEDVDEWYVVES